jgi:anti-sigma factor (TIGR02949 family)|nr:MAG: hypothetical protein KatS3mg041_0337 [Bacteroidota bacterium]
MTQTSQADLTCRQAQELITAFVDGMLQEEERLLLEEHLAGCRNCRLELELERAQKQYLAQRRAPVPVPEELEARIRDAIGELRSARKRSPVLRRTWAMAAVVAGLGLFVAYLLSRGPHPVSARTMSELTLQHFRTTLNQQLPWIPVSDRQQAWQVIWERTGWDVRIPPIRHAELRGVWIGPYLPGIEVPVLHYRDRRNQQPIYVFVFAPECFERYGNKLNLEPEVWAHLRRDQDFYIQELGGRHVLSWRWRGVFYQAVSNHDGRALQAMIIPPGPEES